MRSFFFFFFNSTLSHSRVYDEIQGSTGNETKATERANKRDSVTTRSVKL